jgi:hypothetical protein
VWPRRQQDAGLGPGEPRDRRQHPSADIDPARTGDLPRSRLTDPPAPRADNCDRFFEARLPALLERIGRAAGKAIAREALGAEVPEVVEHEAEGAEVPEVEEGCGLLLDAEVVAVPSRIDTAAPALRLAVQPAGPEAPANLDSLLRSS